MSNILFCSVGRRGRLLQDFKKSLPNSTLIATDNNPTAPALYFADKQYIVPKITDENYLNTILDICKKENVKAITTLIDPEIEILSKNRDLFIENGILPLCPDERTATLCFDKFKMFQYLKENNINTVLTFDSLASFKSAHSNGEVDFPVFIKPRSGSGSVGAKKVNSIQELRALIKENSHDYIIQEFMSGGDIDSDVYVDTITNQPVSIFSKKKLETRIGGASKTISFKDEKLFEFIKKALSLFKFYGPIDVDFFYNDGKYYLSEVNPRFGGAYLHAYGAGVDFIKLIQNNINGIENKDIIGEYDQDVIMMMYDDVVIKRKNELAK
ncbi:ATP-grasp domain-containing protein [Ornithobacterium rhinotracheale]|uniref:ATP-grasp domain-containing protein n=1 Tax=Ornithobacterium rhinotracheale TaxID=28251 RepID=UPI00129C3F5F|nr:ATP-grasp domain-containing protein [Ornithobacterium rhinotracheale]MRJ10846.1 ATP-grasp domain-containing protein [Ornithobacterium rhinotracheale]